MWWEGRDAALAEGERERERIKLLFVNSAASERESLLALRSSPSRPVGLCPDPRRA